MSVNADIFGYNAQNCRDIVDRIIQRKNEYMGYGGGGTAGSDIYSLRFQRERLIGIDLQGAPLYLGGHSEYDLDADGYEQDPVKFEYDPQEYVEHFDDNGVFSPELAEEPLYGVSYRESRMDYGLFNEVTARQTDFAYASLWFASFVGADLADANFEQARLVGTDFAGANLDGTRFTVDPWLLLANFKNAKNIDSARFYMLVDGERYRITGVGVDESGRLVPAETSGVKEEFNRESAVRSVPFSKIYDQMQKSVQSLGLKEVVQKVDEAREQGVIDGTRTPLQKFLENASREMDGFKIDPPAAPPKKEPPQKETASKPAAKTTTTTRRRKTTPKPSA